MVMSMVMVSVVIVMIVGMNLFPAVVVLQSEDLFPLRRTHHVHRAGEAGIKGVDQPQYGLLSALMWFNQRSYPDEDPAAGTSDSMRPSHRPDGRCK